MWPPSSEECLLARTTIAIAFQRMIERSRRSTSRSPGNGASRSAGIVLTYGVLSVAIGPVPACWARSTTRVSRSGAVGPVVRDDRVERLEPLARLDRVDVGAAPLETVWRRCRSSPQALSSAAARVCNIPRLYPRSGVRLHASTPVSAIRVAFRIPCDDGRQSGRRARGRAVGAPAGRRARHATSSSPSCSPATRSATPPAARCTSTARPASRAGAASGVAVGLRDPGLTRGSSTCGCRATPFEPTSSSASTRCSPPATARTRSSCSSTRGPRSAARSSSTRPPPAATWTTCATRSSRSSTSAIRRAADREHRGIDGQVLGRLRRDGRADAAARRVRRARLARRRRAVRVLLSARVSATVARTLRDHFDGSYEVFFDAPARPPTTSTFSATARRSRSTRTPPPTRPDPDRPGQAAAAVRARDRAS